MVKHTHTIRVGNNQRIVWVCLTILWDWRLKDYVTLARTENYINIHLVVVEQMYIIYYKGKLAITAKFYLIIL